MYFVEVEENKEGERERERERERQRNRRRCICLVLSKIPTLIATNLTETMVTFSLFILRSWVRIPLVT